MNAKLLLFLQRSRCLTLDDGTSQPDTTIYRSTLHSTRRTAHSNIKMMTLSSLQSYILSHRRFISEVHGIVHWKQVERNGLLLAEKTHADIMVVRLFALFHDSKRANDGEDIVHGARGAEFAKACFEEHLFEITQEQFDKLYHACKFHTTERRSGDATIDTCYDADRLDLGRVWITLDPLKMATDFGAKIARKSLEAGINPKDMREWLAKY